MNIRTFLSVATERATVVRAVKIALFVGFILVAVNNGSVLLRSGLDVAGWFRVLMNFAVPYCVSTVSTVLAHTETKTDIGNSSLS